MLLRPVKKSDHAAIHTLAREAGYGMTSLPQDAEVLAAKIDWSERSFAGAPPKENEHRFLLVLEDPATGSIVGSAGLKAHVGLSSPFYSYKLSTLVQANRELDVYSLNKVLHMVNDYTGASEIGSLFLLPEYRRDGWGKFLSRSRFLMLAEFAHLFDDIVIAEMRGVHDEQGNSPFYDALARHFFQMPFTKADYVNATKGGQFIADLMPKYPIYVKLLDEQAKQVIGVANEASRPALRMLEREGFQYVGYIDIFDAGPTVRAERATISTVRRSRQVTVADIGHNVDAPLHMAATTQLSDLRLSRGAIAGDDEKVTLDAALAAILGVKKGDTLRIGTA